jgi:hypothetical protein
MKKLLKLLPAISLVAAMLALYPVAAAAKDDRSVVGTVNGKGASDMTNLPAEMNETTFVIRATLFSDGTARGKFICIDLVGDVAAYQGKIFGDFKSWKMNTNGTLSLIVPDAAVVPIPGGPQFAPRLHKYTTVTIQKFGGAGVGHWTMDVLQPNGNNATICVELLSSGRLVGNGEIFGQRDDD